MLPRRLEDRGPVFLDDILKGWLSCPWERHSWVEEDAFTSQRDRGRICNHVFPNKCSKEGRSGT